MNKIITILLTATTFALLGACGTTYRPVEATPAYAAATNQWGVVQSIEQRRRDGTGAGLVVGAIVGGLIGHQIGAGSGNTAATVAGAAGGAYIGNRMEENNNSDYLYRVNVLLDNGAMVTVNEDGNNSLRVGDRVRVNDGRIVM